MARLLWVLTCSLAVACASSTLEAQQQPAGCRPVDGYTTTLADYMKLLVTSTDPRMVATREDYFLPAVPATRVLIVTDTTICRQAAEAYLRATDTSSTAVAQPVSVVRVGSDRYVVQDPNEHVGDYDVNLIFDAAFKVLGLHQLVSPEQRICDQRSKPENRADGTDLPTCRATSGMQKSPNRQSRPTA